jgi:pilus assembly protein CpaC
MTKRFLLFALLLGGLIAGPAAADIPAAPATAPVTATAPTQAAASVNGTLTVGVDHGVSLKLNAPATSVFIANPDIADVQVMSPTAIMIFGKRTGETTFMATDGNGTTLAQRTVMVTQDLFPLRQELNAAIPGNKIRVDSLPNGLILTGEAKDPASVADAYKIAQRYVPSGGDIINRIQVGGSNQIMIRVRFCEISRNVNNTLGFDWGALTSIGGFTFGVATGAIDEIAGGSSLINSDNRPLNTSLSLPNGIIGGSYQSSHANVNAIIDALAQDGLVTILAEPNLTAMSGETANFLAGGEFPIPIPQGLGNISIQFKDYGISLEFTPTIISGDRINLHVKPEVSELTDTGSIVLDNITVPALLTRRAETTVELASGQSFAIAGMLDNEQAQTVNKYPILGDMPVIGALFRSSQFQNGQTELVVIITPYVVKPAKEQLALPTDGLAPPNEEERLLGLRYDSADPNARAQSGYPTGKNAVPPSASAIIPVPVMPESSLTPPNMAAQPIPAPPPVSPTSMADPASPAPQLAATPAAAEVPETQAAAPPAPALASPAVNSNLPAPAPVHESHEAPTSLMPAGPGGFVVE